MTRTRRALMVAFVAAALAGDRVAAAAPALRPTTMAVAARQLAGRLVVSFRRTIPSVRLADYPQAQRIPPSVPAPWIAVFCNPEPFAFSPFQFRLPPPLI